MPWIPVTCHEYLAACKETFIDWSDPFTVRIGWLSCQTSFPSGRPDASAVCPSTDGSRPRRLMPRGSFTGGQQNRLADPTGTSTCHLNTGGGHFSLEATRRSSGEAAGPGNRSLRRAPALPNPTHNVVGSSRSFGCRTRGSERASRGRKNRSGMFFASPPTKSSTLE
jgi:hypothetical protein